MHLSLFIGQPIDMTVELCYRGCYSCKRLPPYQELSYPSPSTFMLANLMVSLDSQIAQRVSHLHFYCCLEDWVSLQTRFEKLHVISQPGCKLKMICNRIERSWFPWTTLRA